MRLLFKMLLLFVFVAAALMIGVWAFLQHPRFGRLPEGDHLVLIEASPNFSDGEFRNLEPAPKFTGKRRSRIGSLYRYIFEQEEGMKPKTAIPSLKTDLKALNRNEDLVVWMGHSSFFVQLGGKRILIDPVFSEAASPVFFVNTAFKGASIYTAADMPEIDFLLITHDHWDHLDHPTVKALAGKVAQVICGLGVGAHLERWGYPKESILEADWFTRLEMEADFTVHVLPARHFSGRWLTRNKSLWVSFALETPARRVFFSGDSGYGAHFKEIGEKFDGFDLVALDTGQYNEQWAHVHMFPEEAAQAAEDLGAKAFLPAHIGRFTISDHTWDDPFKRVTAASGGRPYKMVTPMIGEAIILANPGQQFSRWWEGRL